MKALLMEEARFAIKLAKIKTHYCPATEKKVLLYV